jgi:polyhydroxybutyrate depolymerase
MNVTRLIGSRSLRLASLQARSRQAWFGWLLLSACACGNSAAPLRDGVGSANAAGAANGGRAANAGSLATGAAAATTAGAGGATSAGPTGTPQRSAGCGRDAPASDTSILVGTGTGKYIIDLPTGYDKSRAYPVLTVWHGYGVTAEAFHGYVNFKAAVGADAIVITPNIIDDGPMWDMTTSLSYFDAIIAHLEASYCVDSTRIFAVGHSMGGFFTSQLGCARGDKLRGIAPLSAGQPAGGCKGELAVWISQGKSDTAVSPASGEANAAFWAKQSKCDMSMSKPVDPSPCVEYAGCDAGFPVRFCEYDGDHQPPAFAATGVWDFFKSL